MRKCSPALLSSAASAAATAMGLDELLVIFRLRVRGLGVGAALICTMGLTEALGTLVKLPPILRAPDLSTHNIAGASLKALAQLAVLAIVRVQPIFAYSVNSGSPSPRTAPAALTLPLATTLLTRRAKGNAVAIIGWSVG